MHERGVYGSQASLKVNARPLLSRAEPNRAETNRNGTLGTDLAIALWVGSLGLQVLFGELTDVLSKTGRTRPNFRKAVNALKADIVPDVKVKISVAENNEPVADKRKIFIKPDQSDAVIAHELGHVKNYESLLTKWTLASAELGSLRPFTGLASSAYSAFAGHPSYVPAVAHLTLSALALISEGAASLRAIPALESRSGWHRQAATLAVAFGTYALPAFTPLAMTAVKRHFSNTALPARESPLQPPATLVGIPLPVSQE